MKHIERFDEGLFDMFGVGKMILKSLNFLTPEDISAKDEELFVSYSWQWEGKNYEVVVYGERYSVMVYVDEKKASVSKSVGRQIVDKIKSL